MTKPQWKIEFRSRGAWWWWRTVDSEEEARALVAGKTNTDAVCRIVKVEEQAAHPSEGRKVT